MEIEDLNLNDLLIFDPKESILKLLGQRVLIMDSIAMGILRKELIQSLGISAARTILTRFGFAHGWMAANYFGAKHEDLLKVSRFGPAIHSLQGIVNARKYTSSLNNEPLPGKWIWKNSYEAEQHILQFGIAEEPVCWTLTGYASGFSSYIENQETYCIEHKCVGKGDEYCLIEIRLKNEWGDTINNKLSFFQEENISGVLKNITAKLRKAEKRLTQLQNHFDSEIYPPDIIANSTAMRHILKLAKRSAKVDSSVLVTGESGVGKELVARYIHNESSRNGRPFIAVNCGAITETLLESEFFGHVKGSFTGADRDRMGFFEAANGGTIFLDEIGEMPLDMQAKFLRVLQDKKIRRIGENKYRKVDFRVIAATNRVPEVEVESGRFRQDLYYRLCIIELEVPPLRDRTEDILPLSRFFLDKLSKKLKHKIKSFSQDVIEHLLVYNWPGNARELQNVIERCIALCSGSTINVEDLPYALRKDPAIIDSRNDILPLKEIEYKYILAALEWAKGDKRLAAKKLKIGLTSLYRKLKDHKDV